MRGVSFFDEHPRSVDKSDSFAFYNPPVMSSAPLEWFKETRMTRMKACSTSLVEGKNLLKNTIKENDYMA